MPPYSVLSTREGSYSQGQGLASLWYSHTGARPVSLSITSGPMPFCSLLLSQLACTTHNTLYQPTRARESLPGWLYEMLFPPWFSSRTGGLSSNDHLINKMLGENGNCLSFLLGKLKCHRITRAMCLLTCVSPSPSTASRLPQKYLPAVSNTTSGKTSAFGTVFYSATKKLSHGPCRKANRSGHPCVKQK